MKLTEVYKIQKEYRVPGHVLAHIAEVTKVAVILADEFQKKGFKIRKSLVKKGALLHDVLRICDFRTFEPEKFPQKASPEDLKIWQQIRQKYQKIGHAKAMANILRKKGEKALADIVEKHDFLKVDQLKNWEEKIVYYADKRVEQDKVVPLNQRLTEGAKRNRKEKSNLSKTEEKIFQLEKEIENAIGRLPI